MDSKHLMYETFAEMMVNSFYEFLSKLEKSDMIAIDCPFMKKLEDIDKILQNLFQKNNIYSSTQNTLPSKKICTSNESIPFKPAVQSTCLLNKEISSTANNKIKSTDNSYPSRNIMNRSDDLFERMKQIMTRDVEGSDDSDSEMKYVPVSSEDLFKTDYPEECFVTEGKKENEVSCLDGKKENEVSYQDVSSSLNKSSISSVEDDPYIRILNSEKSNRECNGDTNDTNDPYIVKIIEDVYKCELCMINNLPKNNVMAHVNGRQHKKLRQNGGELKLKEPVESLKVISKMEDVSPIIIKYECTLCKTEINGRDNALQHLNGRLHNRKLENMRVNG